MIKRVALSDLIENPLSGEWGEEGDGINVLRTTNFNNDGSINLNSVVRRNISFTKIKQKILQKGDIIIEKSGGSPNQPVGRVIYFEIEGDYLCNNFTSVLRPKKNAVFSKYLHYLLFASHKYGIVNGYQNKTTGILNLQLSRYIKELKIPLPQFPDQQKIAHILDQADALRKKTQELIDSYNELAQSIFLDMFGDPVRNPKGWKLKILGDICGVGSSKRVFVDELVDRGIPFFRGTEIGRLSEGHDIKQSLFITKEHYDKLKKHTGVPKIGDLLLPSICPDGRILRVESKQPFYFKDGRVLWIKVNELKLNSIYLKVLLKEIFYANYTNIASGTTFAELKIVALKKIKILTPPLTLQNQFADKINSINQQKELAKQSLQQSEDLFNALLQKAFKGKLVNSE